MKPDAPIRTIGTVLIPYKNLTIKTDKTPYFSKNCFAFLYFFLVYLFFSRNSLPFHLPRKKYISSWTITPKDAKINEGIIFKYPSLMKKPVINTNISPSKNVPINTAI